MFPWIDGLIVPPARTFVIATESSSRAERRCGFAVSEDESGGLVVELRAEQSGGSESGRVYQLTVTAQDQAGNAVTGTANCIVPHDRGKGK